MSARRTAQYGGYLTAVQDDRADPSHRGRNWTVAVCGGLLLILAVVLMITRSQESLATNSEPCKATVEARVSMPEPSASAEVVARTFFAAVSAGDYETAALLSRPSKANAWLTPGRDRPSYLGHLCQVSEVSSIITQIPPVGSGLSGDNYMLLDATARVVLKGYLDTDESWGAREPSVDQHYGNISLRLWRESPDSPWRVDWYGGT